MSIDFIIEGKKYTKNNEKTKKGGNGTVFFISCPSNDLEYAVKVFRVKDLWDDQEKLRERYERFRKETIFMYDNKLTGVVPVIKYDLPSNLNEKSKPYYIMPKGVSKKISEYTLITSMRDCLTLAKNLLKIHKMGIAHRDIKPSNIIYYDDVPHFCDFGLIWDINSEKRLTLVGEKVGPSKIIPPELESVDSNNMDVDYRKSDIYLLAKVLWMMVNNNSDGFRGEYDRANGSIYVDLYEKDEVPCFELFHQLMEKSTYDNWNDRIDLIEFINILDNQIKIIEGNFNGDIASLNYYTVTKSLYHSENETDKLYRDINQINDYINNNKMNVKLKLINVNETTLTIINSTTNNGELVFKLMWQNKYIILHCIPDALLIDLNYRSNLTLLNYNDKVFPVFSFIDDLHHEYYINSNFKIEFIMK